jgi:thiamine kinase-like enzyme
MNIEAAGELLDYLRQHGHVRETESPRVTILAGGVSNRTVLVERDGGPDWVIKQALAKLRVEADWFSSPERIHREALGLQWLGRLAPADSIPRFVFEDHEHHLLAMSAVPRPHDNWKTMLMRGEIVLDHFRQFGALLASIHRGALRQSAELEPLFRDTSFFESLRLEPYYSFSARQVPDAAPFLKGLIAQTRATRLSLVHGDFSAKNILVRNGRLVLLDHEVIHWGDPAFDLGFSLALFLCKAHHFPAWRADFARAALLYWQSYDDNSREQCAVSHTLACLLARVVGKSPVEYLDAAEREHQRLAVLRLMARPPARIEQLMDSFISCL